LLRLTYLLFYVQLRTTPEETGYGYARILSESVVGSLEMVLFVFCPLFGLNVVVFGIRRAWSRRHPRRHRTKRQKPLRSRGHPLQRMAVRTFGIAFVVVMGSLPLLASFEGRLARQGETVRNVYFLGVPNLPVLAVQAVVARVTWINRTSQDQFDFASRDCLLYLGEGDGIDVFYDVRSHESIRIPAADAVVSLSFRKAVPKGC
jgi:hypothetical protein